jgi:hypothetical protein
LLPRAGAVVPPPTGDDTNVIQNCRKFVNDQAEHTPEAQALSVRKFTPPVNAYLSLESCTGSVAVKVEEGGTTTSWTIPSQAIDGMLGPKPPAVSVTFLEGAEFDIVQVTGMITPENKVVVPKLLMW